MRLQRKSLRRWEYAKCGKWTFHCSEVPTSRASTPTQCHSHAISCRRREKSTMQQASETRPVPTQQLHQVVYLPFLSLPAPFVFAVPRFSLARFLRCLPVKCIVSIIFTAKRAGSFYRPHLGLWHWCERTLLSAGLLNLGCLSVSHQSVVWLELLDRLGGVVEQREASALAATKLCSQAEDRDLVLVGLVQASELLAEFVLRDVRAGWMEDVTGSSGVSCGCAGR